MSPAFDVAVLGLGGMGSAAAYHLARRGLRVLGLEQFTPAHDRGSSHGGSRIIRQAYFEHPDYVPLLRRAFELWRELERETGRPLLKMTGGLMIGPADGPIVTGSLRSADVHGLKYRRLTHADLRREYPMFEARRGEIALYEEEAGVLFPEECVRAYLDRAGELGADLRFGVKAGAIDEIDAARVVVTAGPWATRLGLGLPLKVERVVMYWFESSAFDRSPIWIWNYPGLAFYGFPRLPNQGVKVAFHHGGEPADPDGLRREANPAEVDLMRRRLAEAIPSLNGPLLQTAACMYTNTPDEHFIVGPAPGRPSVVLAAGFSGHGFKFASVVGEILADLAADGKTRHPIGLFSPTRFR